MKHTTKRIVTGIALGAFFGIAFSLAWSETNHGALWLPGRLDELRPDRWGRERLTLARAVRLFFPFGLGGAAAGGLIAAAVPAMGRVRSAWGITATALALCLLIARVIDLGIGSVTMDFIVLTAIVAAAGGLLIGLLIRDLGFHYDEAGRAPRRTRASRMLGLILSLANRFPWLAGDWRTRRRERIRAQPFPLEWLPILESRLPVYRGLPFADRVELQRQIMVFLAEKRFEGCGVFVTDGMRVTIAAYACLLTLRLDADYYPRLRTILVYPRTFVPKRSKLAPHWDAEDTVATLGESWRAGVIVLSWEHVREGAADFTDGRNLVLHEFAHQLDQEDGAADGVPLLDPPLDYGTWTAILQREFERLENDLNAGVDTVLDPYGMTNLAEFFAVATEAFFETPQQMEVKHAELYEQLKQYYKQDPAAYVKHDVGQPV